MVPEEGKDDRYWERRRKNNMAAKRSRDARRAKENQIAIRAAFLERENKALAQELSKARTENHLLRERLCNCLLYTSPSPRDGLLSRMPSSA